MLAAVGVDYGWHPDGTTSSQGDNIEYIVQIAPDQLQQLKSIGEITSTIDPSVQGRVSRIVVKIGNSPLPQDAGRATKPVLTAQSSGRSSSGFTDAADNVEIPRPQITGNATRALAAVGSASTTRNESLLKPDPQGFAMPDSITNAGQSALDQVRSGVNNVGTQLEAQAKSAIDSIPNTTTQAASDLLNRASDTVRNSINNSLNPSPNTPPSTFTAAPQGSSFQFSPEPSAAGRDNQWSDVSGRSGATTGAPATTPVDPNAARNAPWPNTTAAAQPSTDPRMATDPRAVNDPRAFNNTASSPAFGNTAAAPSTSGFSVPATAQPKTPNDPGWSGYGTSSTFGSAPAGVSLPTNNVPAYNQGSVANTASSGFGNTYPNNGGFANAPTTTSTATVDSGFYNSQTQPPVAHTATNWNTPSTQPNTGSSSTNPWATTTPSINGSLPSTNPVATNPSANNTFAMEQLLAEQRAELRQMQSKMNSLEQRDRAQTNLVSLGDDQVRSASDWPGSAQARADRQSAAGVAQPPATSLPAKARSVDGLKFLNFILLLSLVGNAYLIFETNNLRRKFKNMISSVRTAKVGAQPVTN